VFIGVPNRNEDLSLARLHRYTRKYENMLANDCFDFYILVQSSWHCGLYFYLVNKHLKCYDIWNDFFSFKAVSYVNKHVY